MAQPARKDQSNVYDEDITPDSLVDARPKFEVHKGGGETTEPKAGHLKPVDDDSDSSPEALLENEEKLTNNKASESVSQSEKQEAVGLELASEKKDESLYKTITKVSTKGVAGVKGKKMWAILAVIAGLFIGGTIMLFVLLAPLKILHMTQNLQDRFFATSEDAVDKEVDRLMTSYIRGKMIAFRDGNCKGTKIIDHTCNPYSARDSLVKKLYYGWSDKKLEEKLRKKHGISFAVSDSNTYYVMRFFNPADERIASIGLMDLLDQNSTATIDDIITKDGSVDRVTRQELRLAFKDAMKDETLYSRTMYRIKVGKYLERKYGLKRCIIGCKYKDGYADWKDDKKRAAKMYAAQRVITPMSETFATLYLCVLDEKCGTNSKQFEEITPDNYQADVNGCNAGCPDGGEPKSQFDKDNRDMLAQRLVQLYDGDVDKLRADYDRVRKIGIYASLGKFNSKVEDDGTAKTKSILGKLVETSAFKTAGKAIPVIGQIDMAATIFGTADTLAKAAPAVTYIMNSTATSQYYTMYRTVSDEIKEGDVDNEIVGSFVSSMGPGVQIDSTEEAQDKYGGTAGAEQSPLYANINGTIDERASFANSSGGLLSKTAKALSSTYQCDDGTYPDLEKPVCDEQKVLQEGNKFLAVLSSDKWGLIKDAALYWNKGKNFIVDTAQDILKKACWLPFAILTCWTLDKASDQVAKMFEGVAKYAQERLRDAIMYVFDNLFGLSSDLVNNNMSGAWAYNNLGAGADVSGNSFAHHGLGGRVLTEQEVTTIVNEQEEQRYLAYQSKPFINKIIDTESKYSPASKIAMKMPSSKDEVLNTNFASLISSSIGSLFSSISSLFSNPASAQKKVIDDPFGIQQYGFTENDPTLTEDSESFWAKNCVTTFDGGDNASKWSLTKLYNLYGSYTAEANISGAYSPVNDLEMKRDFKDPIKNAVAKEFFKRSPNGTNRCMLIQSAVGSAGAIFTEDVLSDEEKSGQSTNTQSSDSTSSSSTVDLSGADQSSTKCDSRTRDIGIYQGYQNGNPVKIRLCALPNLPSDGKESNGEYGISGGNGQALVNAAVSKNFYELVELGNSALAGNLKLSANSSFRTMSHQEVLCSTDDKCPNGVYTDVAKPGTSNHQMGLAIDFDIKGIDESVSSCIYSSGLCTANGFADWEWLYKNSERFGLKQYRNEFWHYSPSGS